MVSGESSQTFPLSSRGVVISGMDGIGKSTLVRVAMKDYPSLKENFPDGVFWIDCHESEYEQIIRQLADELDIEPALPVEAELWLLLRRDLRWKKALLVFDGVDSIHTTQRLMEIFGSSRSRCVFTTQQRPFEGELHHNLLSHFTVKSLTDEQGLAMLMRMMLGQISKRQQVIVKQIITRVGGLPLAIEILARLVQATAISWQDLLIQITSALWKR
ncbi:MAG: NB-ARC domain-containing protein [Chloroflexota bacterium]